MLKAVNAGEDRNITLGEYSTLIATELATDATVTWSIVDDVYSNERTFYFSPSSIGSYNIHLTSSDGSDDYVKVQVLSANEDSNESNNNDSNATIEGESNILTDETAIFSTTYQSDTQLSWKLNGDTYAYGNTFYFFPTAPAVYNLTLNDENGELATKVITVTEEEIVVPPAPENNCTATTTDGTCLMLSKKYTQIEPSTPSCYKRELLLKHGENPIFTVGVSLDRNIIAGESCDKKPIAKETITPLADNSYLVHWITTGSPEQNFYLKKVDADGITVHEGNNTIPLNSQIIYQIKALTNGNFIATWSTYHGVFVKVYSSNLTLLSERTLESQTNQAVIIDTQSYDDGSFDIKYKIDLYPDVWATEHFSGN
jgi:hypothetical protein